MDQLYEAFKTEEKVKINASSLPMVLYGGYRTLNSKKSFTKYVDNLNKFIAEYNNNEEYKAFGEKHTTTPENVQGRLNYFKTKVIPS